MSLEQLQARLGYTFGDRSLLLQALTHKSFGHEFFQTEPIALRDNERLEFLGDAILELVVSDLLLESFSNATEGYLSKMRASVVNEKTLASIAKTIQLESFIRLGKGEHQSGGSTKPSILSSTFEALVAAIYLDGGFQVVSSVVRCIFAPFFLEEQKLISFCDYKTQLQEMLQARWKMTPSYHLIDAYGPEHAKVFQIEVRMNEKTLAIATGSSKKEAEQNAAEAAIRVVVG